MDLDRWKQVETIYNSALEVKDSAEREEFLHMACAGDDALRREVVSLLSSAECADSFMEEPVLSLGMALVAGEHEQLAGETIGRYKLLELLGRGGMGAVYLAHDPRLNRRVALKLLPPDITDDRAHIRRFEQEARAASAISHPNVAHIYEIGEADGRSYITMEHVRGRTLRQMMKEGRLKLSEALEIGIQVAAALAAAHEAGVIHRDIKPENIMLHADGYVKVLDFGLAKLVETSAHASDSEAQTLLSLHTEPELLMGTSGYMSPEQVRRQPVDVRTDLWSLGVVLYEMLVAKRPFPGSEPSEVIVAILEREPEPLELSLPEAPEELRRIVATALQKERDKRCQTAAGMLADLRRLSRQLESAAGLEQKNEEQPPPTSLESRQQEAQGKGSASVEEETDGPAAVSPTAEQHAMTVERTQGARASAVRPQPRTPAPRSMRRSVLLALALILGISVPTLLIYRYLKQRAPASLMQSLKFQPLALPGNIKDAAISPDGKFVASVVEQGGKQTLHIMELSTSSDLQIADPSEKGYTGLSFSPDGDYIYYLEKEAETATLYRVSKLGGVKRKLFENVNTPVTFSPDTTQLAFIRYDMAEQSSVLMTASTGGDKETRLVSRKGRGGFPLDIAGAGPAWDPKGNIMACVSYASEDGKLKVKVEAVSLRDGSAKDLTSQKWYSISQLSWLPDRSGLILTGNETSTAPSQIWFLSYPGGEASRVTNDASFYKRASLAKDSQTVLALTLEKRSDIWLVTPNHYEQSRLLTENVPKDDNPIFQATAISWTPDGGIVYSARAVESQNIWLRGTEGGQDKQLTFEKNSNHQPSVTPDGRFVVFVSSRAGGSTIWRMNSDGSQPTQLTTGPAEEMPQVTPDSAWVIYRTVDGIWKVSINGGESTLLLKKSSLHPVVSPDGRMLACFTSSSPQGSSWSMKVFSLADMSPVKRFDLPETLDPFAGLRWSPDGRGLTYVSSADGASNLWLQPLDGNAPQKLTDFKESKILSFGWSPDKNLIACVRGTENIRALLITGFPQ